jgi:hypothetical protein
MAAPSSSRSRSSSRERSPANAQWSEVTVEGGRGTFPRKVYDVFRRIYGAALTDLDLMTALTKDQGAALQRVSAVGAVRDEYRRQGVMFAHIAQSPEAHDPHYRANYDRNMETAAAQVLAMFGWPSAQVSEEKKSMPLLDIADDLPIRLLLHIIRRDLKESVGVYFVRLYERDRGVRTAYGLSDPYGDRFLPLLPHFDPLDKKEDVGSRNRDENYRATQAPSSGALVKDFVILGTTDKGALYVLRPSGGSGTLTWSGSNERILSDLEVNFHLNAGAPTAFSFFTATIDPAQRGTDRQRQPLTSLLSSMNLAVRNIDQLENFQNKAVRQLEEPIVRSLIAEALRSAQPEVRLAVKAVATYHLDQSEAKGSAGAAWDALSRGFEPPTRVQLNNSSEIERRYMAGLATGRVPEDDGIALLASLGSQVLGAGRGPNAFPLIRFQIIIRDADGNLASATTFKAYEPLADEADYTAYIINETGRRNPVFDDPVVAAAPNQQHVDDWLMERLATATRGREGGLQFMRALDTPRTYNFRRSTGPLYLPPPADDQGRRARRAAEVPALSRTQRRQLARRAAGPSLRESRRQAAEEESRARREGRSSRSRSSRSSSRASASSRSSSRASSRSSRSRSSSGSRSSSSS